MDRRAALDELFEVALDRFVETRDRLVGELARAGQKDESRELKKVRRPSPSAWATNQVVRRARPAVDDFLDAGDRLRRSQADVVAGRADPSGYQADVDGLRRATAALAAAARAALAAAGRGDDRHLVDRVVANVRAAALADERRAELLAGALTGDLEAGDELVGGFASGLPAGSVGTNAPPSPAPPRSEEAAAARDEPDRAADDAKAAERARRIAETRAEEAAALAEVARAEAATAAAHARVDEARARVRAAEEAIAAAQVAARAADADVQAANRELARARAEARAAGEKRAAAERERGRST